jgi:hypothetical protein
MSSVRVASGTVASAACLTIGASVPSISSRIAERAGFERICPSASTSVSAGDTLSSMARIVAGSSARARGC